MPPSADRDHRRVLHEEDDILDPIGLTRGYERPLERPGVCIRHPAAVDEPRDARHDYLSLDQALGGTADCADPFTPPATVLAADTGGNA